MNGVNQKYVKFKGTTTTTEQIHIPHTKSERDYYANAKLQRIVTKTDAVYDAVTFKEQDLIRSKFALVGWYLTIRTIADKYKKLHTYCLIWHFRRTDLVCFFFFFSCCCCSYPFNK